MAEEKYLKNRWVILFILVIAPFMACIDSSIVNVALPNLAESFSMDMQKITWIVTLYLIVISSIVLVLGRIGDIISKALLFNIGLAIFSLGALLCGLSQNFYFLLFSRVLQALGSAGILATNQGIIAQMFPQNERGRALGINGTFVALGTLVGPPLGGLILSIASWKYIFLINVPIGLIAFILTSKFLPRSKKEKREKMDIKGAIIFPISIIVLFVSLNMIEGAGSNIILVIVGILVSILLIVVFILIERKTEEPLLDINIFKDPLYSLSIFCSFLTFVALSCNNIIQPFYFRDVLKLSPGTTGLLLIVYPMVLSIVAPISGHLSDKIGSEFLTFLGLSLTVVGLFFMSRLKESSSLWLIGIFISLSAVGNGLFQSPNNSLVMSSVPKNKLGIAGSINALLRNVALTLGIILSTTILYKSMSKKIGYSVSSYVEGREDVFVYGMSIVYLCFAGICLIGAILTAIRLIKNRKKLRKKKTC